MSNIAVKTNKFKNVRHVESGGYVKYVADIGDTKKTLFKRVVLPNILVCCLILACVGPVFGGAIATTGEETPTPREIWERFEKTIGPLEYSVTSDELISSETDPGIMIRRIGFSFTSQRVPVEMEENGEVRWEMKDLWHHGIIYLASDPGINDLPERKGKVVIVGGGSGPYRQSFLSNYGDPIAVRTGYPTMVLPNPGELQDQPGREYSQGVLIKYRRAHPDLVHHSHFRWAVTFLRAMDIFAELLEVPKRDIRAVIGGHSKRATSAFTAAAADPERIAGVVFMGNESLHPEGPESPWWAVSPYYAQKFVRCPIFYLGATNESGYPMFNINRIQEHMERPWTIEMIPNYWHAADSEVQFLNWRMWVSHVFDGRPVTRILDLQHEQMEKGIRFSAGIDSPNTIILAHVWYTRGDPSNRRELVWHSALLEKEGRTRFQAFVRGDLPTIWYVEVQDTAKGFRGYVSSLPVDLTR